VLVVAAVGEPRWAIGYLLVFGLGTVAGMMLTTGVASAFRVVGHPPRSRAVACPGLRGDQHRLRSVVRVPDLGCRWCAGSAMTADKRMQPQVARHPPANVARLGSAGDPRRGRRPGPVLTAV
jgi:hypothetical protein